jgi:hypothetical protein
MHRRPRVRNSVHSCGRNGWVAVLKSRAYILRWMADLAPICGDTGDILVFMTNAEARNHRDVTFGDLAADHIEVVRVE